MEGLLHGFASVLTPMNLSFAFIGCFLGTIVGVLPGIGPIGAMALLLGATYSLPVDTALIMFAGIYYGSMYGGSTTSILLKIPGESSSVVTVIDGHQMALKGRGGAALAIAAVGSFVAGTIGLVLLSFLAPHLAGAAVKFGPAEYFAIAVFGLVMLSQLSEQGLIKSMMMVGLGLLIGTVGIDQMSGYSRFTFGLIQLQSGMDFVALAMGLYGIAEMLHLAEQKITQTTDVKKVKMKDLLPTRTEAKRSVGPTLRASVLGFFVGLIPGPAAVISTFSSYILEKKISKHPEEFGKGAPEGVAGPESANNAAAVGAFVPLLSLGIPFAPGTVLLLAAMLVHDVVPGPLLIRDNPDIFWGVIASMYIGNCILLILNLPLINLLTRLLRVPANLLMPIIIVLCIVGAFAVNNSVTEIIVMIVAGVAGYIFNKLDFPIAPLLLALVLGPMLESSFIGALMISHGSLAIFVTRPLSGTIAAITGLVIILPLIMKFIKKFNKERMQKKITS